MAWYLYLIECEGGSIYTGVTNDVAARYAKHASGKGARYTRAHPPLRLLMSMEFANRSLAQKAEYRVKRLSASEKRAFCRQHAITG
ncbi:MAG: GIY-YIG nuclease family protein [Sterolibacterium sp.]|nr:GIY-YIG nuclease family protein [Sterolibacterium sp.]